MGTANNLTNNLNTTSNHAVAVLLVAGEAVNKAVEETSTVLLTPIHQMATVVLPRTKAHPRIKDRQLPTTLIILPQASIRVRVHKALVLKVMAQVAGFLVHSGKVTTIISSIMARHIKVRLSNILSSHQCNTIRNTMQLLHHCLPRTTIQIMLHSKGSTNHPSMVHSNLRNFKILINHLHMVTVCHLINMLHSSGLVRHSKPPHSLTIAVVAVVGLSMVVEVMKPH
jgi:hypothetical protein